MEQFINAVQILEIQTVLLFVTVGEFCCVAVHKISNERFESSVARFNIKCKFSTWKNWLFQ